MRAFRTLLTVGLFALLGLGYLWSAPMANARGSDLDLPGCNGTPEQCASEWLSRTEEGIACVAKVGWTPCKDAWHARGWAISTAVWLFGEGPDGNMGNAFQHCAWIGAIATWHNAGVAIIVGENHEEIVPNEHHVSLMDLRNNEIGAGIGETAKAANPEDMWGFVMNTCSDMARGGDLYGPCGIGLYTPDSYTHPIRINECPSSDSVIA